MRICETAPPEQTVISETQSVRCWLQHPYAKQSGSPGSQEARV
jgi:oligopeptide transport system ATP-binding protein